MGSSPLARGPQSAREVWSYEVGLIPARAGTTYRLVFGAVFLGAHPRSRGDHLEDGIEIKSNAGSSPLARGPLIPFIEQAGTPGLIPARAGTTIPVYRYAALKRAHPRSRGDHPFSDDPFMRNPGSSPLARGPHGAFPEAAENLGLIPARAGTTLADMGFYPLHQQNRITLKPEPKSRIHDKQQLLTTTSTAIPARLTPP